jgi:hypothetical protein
MNKSYKRVVFCKQSAFEKQIRDPCKANAYLQLRTGQGAFCYGLKSPGVVLGTSPDCLQVGIDDHQHLAALSRRISPDLGVGQALARVLCSNLTLPRELTTMVEEEHVKRTKEEPQIGSVG